jgi:2,3-dihydroxybenzoate decarboxylase
LIVNGKIALEEHFVTSELESYVMRFGDGKSWLPILERLKDTERQRLSEMDAHGIEIAMLSLGSDGIQSIGNAADAVVAARAANDALADIVGARPDRFGGFAALPPASR